MKNARAKYKVMNDIADRSRDRFALGGGEPRLAL